MGFLDDILGNEKPETKPGREGPRNSTNPFEVTLSLSPLRLAANTNDYVELLVRVRNVSDEAQLASVDVFLPMGTMLGFETACINKTIEKRIGEIKSGETKEVTVPIWANSQTRAGDHKVDVAVFTHYQTFSKIIASLKRSFVLRIV